ncbi:hypothetical protein BDW22DRAFT_1428098 [Trametopsis cervina]|nr:hypothetical protein BDW22DRAFT_1428098 [Trametopsis cervina]
MVLAIVKWVLGTRSHSPSDTIPGTSDPRSYHPAIAITMIKAAHAIILGGRRGPRPMEVFRTKVKEVFGLISASVVKHKVPPTIPDVYVDIERGESDTQPVEGPQDIIQYTHQTQDVKQDTHQTPQDFKQAPLDTTPTQVETSSNELPQSCADVPAEPADQPRLLQYRQPRQIHAPQPIRPLDGCIYVIEKNAEPRPTIMTFRSDDDPIVSDYRTDPKWIIGRPNGNTYVHVANHAAEDRRRVPQHTHNIWERAHRGMPDFQEVLRDAYQASAGVTHTNVYWP